MEERKKFESTKKRGLDKKKKREISRKTVYKSGITSSGYLFQQEDLVSVVGGNAVGNKGKHVDRW